MEYKDGPSWRGKANEVEFQYRDGQISNLFCDCPCGYTCKHEVAVLLQLRETLKVIEKDYGAQWDSYFAIVSKPMLAHLGAVC